MPLLIPTRALAKQTLNTIVNNQSTTLNIYALGQAADAPIFMDILLNNTLVIGGIICRNMTVIVRDLYLGYSGDFAWADTQGTDDPQYGGLGSRWQLWYWYPSELAAAGLS